MAIKKKENCPTGYTVCGAAEVEVTDVCTPSKSMEKGIYEFSSSDTNLWIKMDNTLLELTRQ